MKSATIDIFKPNQKLANRVFFNDISPSNLVKFVKFIDYLTLLLKELHVVVFCFVHTKISVIPRSTDTFPNSFVTAIHPEMATSNIFLLTQRGAPKKT